jgi:hypothetical protein
MERFEAQGSRSVEQNHEECEFYSRIGISGHREERSGILGSGSRDSARCEVPTIAWIVWSTAR